MREILFRGKEITTAKWVYGGYYGDSKRAWIRSVVATKYGREILQYEVDPSTVGQYTGLTDKNGKRIFEGDILQDDFGIGVVAWVTEHCAFICKSIENGSVTGYHYLQSSGRLTKTIIIGTIHDNPELLEVSHV